MSALNGSGRAAHGHPSSFGYGSTGSGFGFGALSKQPTNGKAKGDVSSFFSQMGTCQRQNTSSTPTQANGGNSQNPQCSMGTSRMPPTAPAAMRQNETRPSGGTKTYSPGSVQYRPTPNVFASTNKPFAGPKVPTSLPGGWYR